MTYNVHPIIVHFPIAFLVLYSLIVMLPVKRWFPHQSWKLTRLLLVGLGFLGILASMSSGEAAQSFTSGSREVVKAHEAFASTSSWFYGLLLAGEILPFIAGKVLSHIPRSASLFTLLNKVLRNETIVWLLALGGFVALTITGMLGGVLVHGTSADPLAAPLLNLLGIS